MTAYTDLTFDTPLILPETANVQQTTAHQCIPTYHPVTKPTMSANQDAAICAVPTAQSVIHSTSTDLGHPTSPKIRRTCTTCSTLANCIGYGKVTPEKVYFDPAKVNNTTSFSLETFIYFMRHRSEGLVHFDLSYCPGCKGVFTISSPLHSTSYLASMLRAYLYSHHHIESK